MNETKRIGAIVLAAGLSKRMGKPKMILPWGKTTVLGQVIATLQQAEINDIVVVSGGAHQEVTAILADAGVVVRFNPDYANGEMLDSFKVGLRSVPEGIESILLALGDQPRIDKKIIASIITRYLETGKKIIVPSFLMHRGHPWLVNREMWQAVFNLNPPATMRDFLDKNSQEIEYVTVDNDSVLQDLDTLDDYYAQKPV
jgi:molybdenum cofactor cytidylyltransferase